MKNPGAGNPPRLREITIAALRGFRLVIHAHAVLQPFGQFVNAMWVRYFSGIGQFSICDGLVARWRWPGPFRRGAATNINIVLI